VASDSCLSTEGQRSGSAGAPGCSPEGRLHADPGGAIISAVQLAIPRAQNVASTFAQRGEHGLLPALHTPHFSHHVFQLGAQPHSLCHHVTQVRETAQLFSCLCYSRLHGA